ncbi:hypothetical protein GGTG_10806 [Gaeumannomyces tritici R3-111a-1]|uniref:Uncharacterized protein n=1 Tax=Gaeumannomyces tritici (strain R3-111a-1) TaxID=644352 RepID=J3PBD3_GAET3|nr:hypothetical protein GGTG_10806 [Gaeumannomyces tritici R3-111a-1]EJT71549.1 hypothetical protein GGTG_10806 [Gaeumannomyces tritici R3-111a-1]
MHGRNLEVTAAGVIVNSSPVGEHSSSLWQLACRGPGWASPRLDWAGVWGASALVGLGLSIHHHWSGHNWSWADEARLAPLTSEDPTPVGSVSSCCYLPPDRRKGLSRTSCGKLRKPLLVRA